MQKNELRTALSAMSTRFRSDSYMCEFFELIAWETAAHARAQRRAVITAADVAAAVFLCLPGELGKHADSEGRKAVKLLKQHEAGEPRSGGAAAH
jgi:hypothetical protein